MISGPFCTSAKMLRVSVNSNDPGGRPHVSAVTLPPCAYSFLCWSVIRPSPPPPYRYASACGCRYNGLRDMAGPLAPLYVRDRLRAVTACTPRLTWQPRACL